ncbi:hypothetical protein [Anoxybacillus eryuanensis]|uniref:hypothetical protein n=1 Tax=Anoxybacillus eryuanensis TaxID=651866 RepID=UPI003EF9BEED
MIRLQKKIVTIVFSMLLISIGVVAQAGTSYEGYDVIVPKFNGNAFTPQQEKSKSSESVDLKVSTLGKAVDARAHSYDGGTGNWVRIATVGGPFKLPNSIKKGAATRVEFSTDFNEVVDVRVKGEWRSN